MAPAITLDQHNKTLQLSPRRPLESAHAFPNSMRCWTDAAAQLSSMLGVEKFAGALLINSSSAGSLGAETLKATGSEHT
jgi:hypothetical protein